MFKCLNQSCTEIIKGRDRHTDTHTDTAFYSLGCSCIIIIELST